jgi:hypothetical protein
LSHPYPNRLPVWPLCKSPSSCNSSSVTDTRTVHACSGESASLSGQPQSSRSTSFTSSFSAIASTSVEGEKRNREYLLFACSQSRLFLNESPFSVLQQRRSRFAIFHRDSSSLFLHVRGRDRKHRDGLLPRLCSSVNSKFANSVPLSTVFRGLTSLCSPCSTILSLSSSFQTVGLSVSSGQSTNESRSGER